jgi:hypothetical protein
MGAFTDLIKVARLSPNLHRLEETVRAAKAAMPAERKLVQYADVPPGRELPGLNRVESADAVNQLHQYRINTGQGDGGKVNIPLYAGDGNKNWRGIYDTMRRTNEKSWWGSTTGDVGYDRHVIDSDWRAKNEIGVDVIRMTPQEYINIIQDFPDKSTPTDDFLAETIRTGQPEYSSHAAQQNIDSYAKKMVAEGNTPIPVLDYVNHKRDGLLRAMAAQRLGIKDMPVTVIRSNAPAETLIRVDKETGIYRADVVREGSPGSKPKDLFGSITTKFSPEKNMVMVEYSKLKPEHYGRGLGMEMYENLIQKVVKDGHKFASDDTLSPESYRVWQSLQKHGYRVSKNPNVREISIAGEFAYRAPKNQPIFEITGLPVKPEKPMKVASKPTRQQINSPTLTVDQMRTQALARARASSLDNLRAQQEAQLAALKAQAEKDAVIKARTIREDGTKIESTNPEHIRNDQIRQFSEWLKTQRLPPGYDADMLHQSSLQNASDVPIDEIFKVARSTAMQYMDDGEAAFDAGITNELRQ